MVTGDRGGYNTLMSELSWVEKGEPMSKRIQAPEWPRKGSYQLPDGGYGHDHTYVTKDGPRIRITSKLKSEPDLKDLTRALIEHAKQLNRERQKNVNS